MRIELRARNEPDAPRLTLDDDGAGGRQIRVHGADGSVVAHDLRGTPASPAALASYTTTIRTVRSPDSPLGTKTRRTGLRLEAGDGTVLAWLANAEFEMFGGTEIQAFTRAAGLRLLHHGELTRRQLRAAAPDGVPTGPGTGAAGSWLATSYRWLLAGALVGGLLLSWPWLLAAGIGSDPTGAQVALVFVVGLGSLFLGAALGPALGVLVLIARERWHVSRRPGGGLRPRRAPGVVLVPTGDDVLVFDPFDRHRLGGARHARITPYHALDAPRWRAGVVLSAHGRRPIVVPGRFDPAAVTAFAQHYGLVVGPEAVRARDVPFGGSGKRSKGPAYRRLRRSGGNVVRSLSPTFSALVWVPPALVLGGAAIAIASLLGLLADPWTGSLVLLGALLLVGCGTGMATRNAVSEFVRPATLPEPVPLRASRD